MFDPHCQFIAWLSWQWQLLCFPPVAGDSIHSGVSNLLKSGIAEVKSSMHAFCLHETATAGPSHDLRFVEMRTVCQGT